MGFLFAHFKIYFVGESIPFEFIIVFLCNNLQDSLKNEKCRSEIGHSVQLTLRKLPFECQKNCQKLSSFS